MIKTPYIFGHRGAMGYCVENTLESFRKAVKMGAGIETDVQLTKDGHLICFHDPYIDINEKSISISKLYLEELLDIKFPDKRHIPEISEVFRVFGKRFDVKFSCDIRDLASGTALIDNATEYDCIDKVLITEKRIITLNELRKYNEDVDLIHTLPDHVGKISVRNVDFNHLHEINVKVINLRSSIATFENFSAIIQNGLACYVWNVNTIGRAQKILDLNIDRHRVEAIYTDYPDKLIKLRNQFK
jgi:glycerophosphoryl diester phosphodiesterase